MRNDTRKWFDVTVRQEWHATYKVLARDGRDAVEIADSLLCTGKIDPPRDDPESFDGGTEASEGEPPADGDKWYEKETE